MVLTRDQIIAVRDLKTKEIQPPGEEWKGGTRIQQMNALAMERYVMLVLSVEGRVESGHSIEGMAEARAKIAVMCLIDDNGDRLFADEDWEILAEKSHDALKYITDEIATLSGFGEDAEKEPSFEETRGESPGDPSESSTST
jgi:hypothetical protein